MEFLNGTTELKYMPDGSTIDLLSKIDKRIVIDGQNKGFICSSEAIPIFIGYKNFGLPAKCFDEYCLFLGVETAVFMYNDQLINVDLTDDNVNVDASQDEHIQPYLDLSLNLSQIILPTNANAELIIYGKNFDTYMNVFMGDTVTILGLKDVTPTQATIMYKTSSLSDENKLVLSRGNTRSFGLDMTITVSDTIVGTGLPGSFITDFEHGGIGTSLWGIYWDLAIFGNIASINNFFASSQNGTPSSSTGPNSVSQFTNSLYYAFTERSSSNYGIGQYATATTSNFSELTSIEFEWHFLGNSTLEFSVRAFNAKLNSWETLWLHSGAGIHAQADDAELVSLPVNSDYTKVQFYFGEASNFAADLAIGNIVITSV